MAANPSAVSISHVEKKLPQSAGEQGGEAGGSIVVQHGTKIASTTPLTKLAKHLDCNVADKNLQSTVPQESVRELKLMTFGRGSSPLLGTKLSHAKWTASA